MVPAVPAVPTITTGNHMCFSMSQTLATLQSASRYSVEKRPPALAPKTFMPMYMKMSAKRKLGVAKPMKPMKVNR